jgi:small-conductance mechanosensitive channel
MRKLCGYKFLPVFVVFSALLLLAGMPSAGQSPTPAANNSNSDLSLDPNITPTPVPFSDIISQAKSTSSSLKEMAAGVATDPSTEIIERGLPGLTQKIDAKLTETATLIESRPTIEKLRSSELEWNSVISDLPRWKEELTARAKSLDGDLETLKLADAKWKKTLTELGELAVPGEVTARVSEILATITQLRTDVEAVQSRTVALQGRVSEQQDRADEAIASIKQTRQSLVGRLLDRDSPPIWGSEFWLGAQHDLSSSAIKTVTAQFDAIYEFAYQNIERIALHFVIFAALAFALFFAKRRSKPWVEKEPALKNASVIFNLWLATAFVIAIFVYPWIYDQTPQIIQAIFGAAVLIPTVMIVRKLVERPIYPILYSLVAFFFIDQFRMIIEPLPVFFRLVFMAEMLGGALFFLWIYFGKLGRDETEEIVYGSIFKTIKTAAIIAVPIFALSFLANALGFVGLARLTGNAVLKSAYSAVILYTMVRILDGLLIFALRLRPLSLLGMVKNNRAFIQHRLRLWLRWLVFILWLLVSLDLLSLLEPTLRLLGAVFSYDITIGSFVISLGDILAFIITVFAAFMLSRLIRFILNEDVYPRTNLARGLPYAISTVLNYTIILIGFFIALAVIGLDLTKFTVLAGAFGVGIGFGLQNIVNNFVSGLILLFERPVNVGDTVQVGADEGDLSRIGLRASVLRTPQGSEVIVPNGELISSRVVNWTLSNQQRRIEVNVGVAYGTDPHKVIELLTKVANENEKVLISRPARVLFAGFGPSSLDFQVRLWTDHFDEWVQIKSDLSLAVHDALYEAGIELPFPQTDIHLRSIPKEIRIDRSDEIKTEEKSDADS